MPEKVLLKIGNLEFTLEQAIAEGLATVLNGKVYVNTNEPVSIMLPAGVKLAKDGILLLENGEDVQVEIEGADDKPILLILKGMGELLASNQTEANVLQVFQLADNKVLEYASLDQVTAAAAAAPEQGTQDQQDDQQPEDPGTPLEEGEEEPETPIFGGVEVSRSYSRRCTRTIKHST